MIVMLVLMLMLLTMVLVLELVLVLTLTLTLVGDLGSELWFTQISFLYVCSYLFFALS